MPILEPPLEDNVEMNSLEPTELVQPKKQTPKPPSTYFKPPSRKDLSDSPKRTTVIKITEYPSDNLKKPAKFEFLNNNGGNESFDEELAKTLSRVNRADKGQVNVNRVVNGDLKPSGGGNFVQTIVPVLNVGQNELCSVKQTLKPFEKNRGANTIIVQIPKRG